MDERRPNLALRLVEERARLGYSQADFARKMAISREGLRLYETGQRGMAAEFLAEAASLGLDVQYVLTGHRSSNTPRSEAFQSTPNVAITTSGGNAVGVVQAGATIHQITSTRHVTKTVAQVTPGVEHISEQQATTLTGLVNDVVEIEAKLREKPKTHRAVWAALNAHCGVTRYRLIRLEDFEKARAYLHQWAGRLHSMPSAQVKTGDEWRKRHYAYIKINTKGDPTAVDAYAKKNFGTASLSELSNDQLERVYRYVAGKRLRT